jgi:hypothetical protein
VIGRSPIESLAVGGVAVISRCATSGPTGAGTDLERPLRRSGLPVWVIRSKRGCMSMCAPGRGWPLLLLSPLLSVAANQLIRWLSEASVHNQVAQLKLD